MPVGGCRFANARSEMDHLKTLVNRAREGDTEAFGDIVRQFEDVARGCARSILRDTDLAEDAAQDAFVQAYRSIPALREPEAFAGWLRRIVANCCHRMTRGKRLATVSLDAVLDLPSCDLGPAEAVEKRELRQRVLEAVRALPEHERVVTQLYYMDGCSQNDIAVRLNVPVSTVNSRLHSSRRRLRERIIELAVPSPVERASGHEKRHYHISLGVRISARACTSFRLATRFAPGFALT